jgi:hypothetical protein
VLTVAPSTSAIVTVTSTSGTTASSWNYSYAGINIASGKVGTFSNSLTLAGTDGSTLNIGSGGTLGNAAYTNSSAYEVPLTFSTGLTRSTNTITVNTSQNIAKLNNLTTNGFVKTSGSDGTLTIDTSTYLTSLSGAVLTDQTIGQTIGNTSNRLTKLWATDITVTNPISGSVTGNAGTVTTDANLTGDVTSSGNATTVVKINGTTLSSLGTGILKNTTGTGVPSIAVAGDFPTLNQNTTGSAATLTTPRSIYGNNFDGSASLNQIIASTYGGTGNGFTKFSGPTTSEKTFTLPDANATLARTDAGQTFTGVNVFSSTISGNINGNAATVTTDANLTGAVTSVGNTTSLGSFSSANLSGALTDETGSGSAVFATSPTLTTPNIGVATGSGLTLTSTTSPQFKVGYDSNNYATWGISSSDVSTIQQSSVPDGSSQTGGSISLVASAGGASDGSNSGPAGGTGGNISLTTGTGGIGTDGSGASTVGAGGNGGNFVVNFGAGGEGQDAANGNTGGTGGGINWTLGTGGNSYVATGGNGGSFQITGGNGGSPNGLGGNIILTPGLGGDGSTYGFLEIPHGNVTIGSSTTTSLFNVGSSAQFQLDSNGRLLKYNNAALTDGQLLIGSTSNGYPVAGTLTGTTNNLTVTNGSNSITLNVGTNVPTSVVNDTNVTGSIASNALTLGWTGTLAVNRGGTGTGTAGIGAFNNITGLSAAGTTGTTTTNLVFSTSPNLVTPALGDATGSTLNVTPTSNAAAITATGTNVTSANLLNLASKNTSGTISNISYGSGTTLAGALTGQTIDLKTNVTNAAQSVNGLSILTPTTTAGAGTTLNAIAINSPGAVTNSSGTSSWTGLNVTMPAITQSGGTLTSTGLKITGGTVSSGTAYAITTDANAGNVGIGTTTPTARLDIVDTSVPLQIGYDNNTNYSTFDVNSGGTLEIRDTNGVLRMVTPAANPNVAQQLQINSYGSVVSSISLARANGTEASPTAVSGNTLGNINFSGYDGTSINDTGASISGLADSGGGAWSGSNRGSFMTFSTTPNSSTTLTERLRINSNGSLGVATTSSTGVFNLSTPSSWSNLIESITGTTSGSTIIQANPTTTSNSSTQITGINDAPNFNPSGTPSTLDGLIAIPSITGSSGTIATYNGLVVETNTTSGFTGTVTNDNLVSVGDPTISGGTINNLVGISIGNLSQGSVTNRGVVSGVSSGSTGAYNIYAYGTAPNYFAGNVGIGTTDHTYNLMVVGNDGTASDTNGAFAIEATTNNNQRLHMGYSTSGEYGWIEAVKVGTNLEPIVLEPRGGNVSIGSTTTTSLFNVGSSAQFQINSSGQVATDLTFVKEQNRNISIDTSTTGSTAGGNLTILSGAGNGAASGNLIAKSANMTGQNTGTVSVTSGNATTSGNSGAVSVDAGTAAGGTVGTVSLGDTNATTVAIGTTKATTINLGATGSLTRTINIGTGTSGVNTIHIGDASSGANLITIGNTSAGASSFISGAALTLTAGATSTWSTSTGDLNLTGAGALNLTASNGNSTWQTSSGTLSIKSGDKSTTALNISTVNASAISTAGYVNISTGTGGIGLTPGNNPGGNGGNILFSPGAGGAAGNNGTGGNGGTITGTFGSGGAGGATGTGGVGAGVSLTLGTGGSVSGAGNSGAGGAFSVTGGDAGTNSGGTGAIGGAISLTGGHGYGGSAGGGASLIGGAASTVSSTSGNGGAVTITGGAAGTTFGTGTGGAINITSGAGGASSGGSGAIALLTGNTSSGTAGNISLDVGTSTSSNGSITIGTAARNQTITLGSTSNTAAVTINSAVATTNSALIINDNSVTTGTAFSIPHTTSVIASGGSLFRLSSSSVDTGTTTGTLLDLASSGSTAGTIALITNNTASFTGTGLSLVENGVTSGKALAISSNATSGITSAGSNVGSLLDVTESGAMTAMTGQLVSINASGNNTSGATGSALNINLAGSGQLMKGITITDATTGGTTDMMIMTYSGLVNTSVASTNKFIRFMSSSGTALGQISGNSSSSVGVLYTASSDARIKHDIVDTHMGLDDLMKIHVRDFVFNGDNTNTIQTGFIAQELETVYPEAVAQNGDDGTTPLAPDAIPWSVDYGKVTPLIVKAIQDLNLKVESLSTLNISPAPSLGQYASAFFSDVVQNVQDGVAYIKGLVVDTLKVGSPTNPTGITLYDQVTGDPYCLSIANGVTKTTQGECQTIAPATVTPPTPVITTPTVTVTPPDVTPSPDTTTTPPSPDETTTPTPDTTSNNGDNTTSTTPTTPPPTTVDTSNTDTTSSSSTSTTTDNTDTPPVDTSTTSTQ